ncbi:MAG: hypothetical protein DCF31_06780 [Alphaproteobacteria bacterium]|nr:MAG: hypothetical protein DCF31_06780 [Alphaproteobacteria bacterium]
MNVERAIEIIESHGADAHRWPAGDRAAVQALTADPRVAAALATAREVDALLDDWAATPVAGRIDLAAIARLPQQAPPQASAASLRPRNRGWIMGGAMAAALAGIIALAPFRNDTTSRVAGLSNTAVPSATVAATGDGSDAEAFAYVFTPTADEDELI